jgi:mono/diheme cytochrome c family protein
MEDHLEKVICIIKNGINGELVVNGKSFNKAMPGIPTLTDLEIAEIATYIYNSWEHAYGIVEVRDVSGILTECNSQE